ncbi:MAG: hypothetical protein GX911_06755 [Spirochaetales bacterium]|nr:hypothetical protein [Spirochaetales bacterium]
MDMERSGTRCSDVKTVGLISYKKLACSVLLLMVVLALPLVADSLSYDQRSGRLNRFDVSVTDDPAIPSAYQNGTQVWRKSGFIGRVVYTGPPETTFTFTNSGPAATGAPAEPRFYFTRESDPSSWSEFFLVVRTKGTWHDAFNTTDEFSNTNVVVVHPGESVMIPHGGGDEVVDEGQLGYSTMYALQGIRAGDLFKYKYPYKSVWMDVTLIRTGNSSSLVPYSLYQSDITVTASTGASLLLPLTGEFVVPLDHSPSLSYDPASGSYTGFDIGVPDNPSNPNAYNTMKEVWRRSGFIGRVVYTGPPTSFSFTNTGPEATNPPTPSRFYFTRPSDPSSWKEFFLVIKPMGITHDGSRIEIHKNNNEVVEHPNDTITLLDGAGFEEVGVGQYGYSANGTGGYRVGDLFKYKYPYKYIWMDVTLIRTANSSDLVSDSSYHSDITMTADSGPSLPLLLSGKYEDADDPPSFYSFRVMKTVPDPFPISDLAGRTTPAQGLKVGAITYSSYKTIADIHFAANAAGTPEDFYFRHEDDTNLKFPYHLAFQPTRPIGSIEQVNSGSRFRTASQTVYSPIDYPSPSHTHTLNYLEGDLKIYLPTEVKPASGLYTSTVYCFVTPVY